MVGMNMFQFAFIDLEQQGQAAFALMQELRPHLTDMASFKAQIHRQHAQNYQLLAAWQGEQLQGLAGYRIQENLLYGKFLYVDDLVTAVEVRSQGLGQQLIEVLREQAKQLGCASLVLDTGLANVLGQRFYYRQGLLAKGLHFSQSLV